MCFLATSRSMFVTSTIARNANASWIWWLAWLPSPVALSACIQILQTFWSGQSGGWSGVRIMGSLVILSAIVAGLHLCRGCRLLSACCASMVLTEFASPVVCIVGAVIAWWFPSFPARDDGLEAVEFFQRENGRLPKRNKLPSGKSENTLAARFHRLLRSRGTLTIEQHARLTRLERGSLSTEVTAPSISSSITTAGQANVGQSKSVLVKVARRLRRKTPSMLATDTVCTEIPVNHSPVELTRTEGVARADECGPPA